ncbi:hypothetical protein [Paracoccus sp. JM45]|uniref:hypothetical protein n=1 Tax=Paracoccus sp. JM45 TaxID=2283626 RepID=UPI000E6CEA97|nr:hypothetical protein [Paracoccus sp. JM45]RJE81408.1 hypothetical protein DWB67_01805 [Paracoccus sp. JM45]
MNLSKLTSSAALIALIAGAPFLTMVSSASAQDAAPQAAVEMPSLLQGLNLEGVDIETGRDGQREYEGKMADGTEIEASFDMAGNLNKIEADDGVLPAPVLEAAVPAEIRNSDSFAMLDKVEELHNRPGMIGLKGQDADGGDLRLMFDMDGTLTGVGMKDAAVPQDLLDSLLPQAVRDADVMDQFATIDRVMTGRERIMIAGEDADGKGIRAQLDEAGNVLRFGRGGDHEGGKMHGDRKDHGERGEHRGERGPRGDHGDHGPRGDHGDRGDHGPRGDHGDRGDHSDRDAKGPRGDAPAFDAEAATQRLNDAGYSDLGEPRRGNRGVAIEATNPDGESVVLHLNPKGEVVRETAR